MHPITDNYDSIKVTKYGRHKTIINCVRDSDANNITINYKEVLKPFRRHVVYTVFINCKWLRVDIENR